MEVSDSSRRILASMLEARTGQQLAMNRRWRIDTALAAIIRERGFASVDQLVSRLVSGREAALTEQVIEALLNNETYFFRDKLPFDLLLGGPVKQLERARAAQKRLSIWSAGCSTGQEVYSLAMSFADEPARWQGWTVDIIGTDLSRSAIERARGGTYSQFEVQRGLPVMQMIRWFEELGGGDWRVSPKLRDRVRFDVRGLIEPPPHPARFDIILCRNVLLYLCAEKRALAFERLASAMAPDGWLMLGAGETVIGQTRKLASDPKARGLYRLTGESSKVEKRAGHDRRAAVGA
jgi:chemotaxis protein methyltransferase CheR